MKNFKFYKTGCLALALAGAISLTGCSETEYIADQTQIYDTIDSNVEGEVSIAPQELSVPGENFKLVVNYSIFGDADNKWRVTSDKDLYIEAHTLGLPEGYRVWIDNVHIDTFILSTKKDFDGILQDTMDDRIHNSLMTGFPISDTTSYSSINLIEGQNQDFIQGTFIGYSGYSGGDIKQRRYSDYDYLSAGVYANKIGLVFGLLVQGPNDLEPHGVDVKSNILVTVYNRVEKIEGGRLKTYQFDRNGKYTVIAPEEYADFLEEENSQPKR